VRLRKVNLLYRSKRNSLISKKNVGKEQIEFTLIFGDAVHLAWLNKIMKKGFAHVSVVLHYKDYSVLINPRLAYNDIACYAGNGKIVAGKGETVIRRKVMVDIYKLRRMFGPLSCVETVKAFIGDRTFWCLTPYQLYKRFK
jgi:hypothetical protein